MKRIFSRILSVAICLLMIAVVSIRRDGKLIGHEIRNEKSKTNDTITKLADGTIVVNTTSLSKDITGFGGNVPLNIYIKDGVVKDIKALPNKETPEFFGKASSLLDKWKGKTVDEATKLKVDGVSGATYSSRAIIENMKMGLQYAGENIKDGNSYNDFDISIKNICGIVVCLMAAILPLFVRNRKYRLTQQVLNIAVLGFWCGAFLSWSSIIGYMSNGINVISLMIPTILIIVAFVYPIFGKKNYYCTNVCPFGGMQEIAGKCFRYKIKMNNKTLKTLNTLRRVLFSILMLCLWTGVWADWIDYEPFSAFIFHSASWIVIVIAVTFILLSTIVMRPYCRFVCPMGSLFKIMG